MRAVVFHRHGGPEELVVQAVEDPRPAPGECLVRVLACGVEPGLDLRTRAGVGNWALGLPHVLGASAVGEVLAPDSDGEPKVGQRVALIPSVVCRRCRYCRTGRDNACARRDVIGVHRWGGYAELLVAPAENLVPLPSDADPVTAAALSVSYVTAWHMLFKRAVLRPTDTVLVTGASGPVGYAAAEIAGILGVRVIVVGRDDDKLALLDDRLSPAALIDLRAEDVVERVKELTRGRGADVVVETVGQAMWSTAIAALAPEGRLVCCGGSSGRQVEMTLRDLYRGNISLLFSSHGTHQDAREMYAAFAEKAFSPLVTARYRLEDAARAHAAVEEGRGVGKVVLTVGANADQEASNGQR